MAHCLYKGDEQRRILFILDNDDDLGLSVNVVFCNVTFSIDSSKHYTFNQDENCVEESDVKLIK